LALSWGGCARALALAAARGLLALPLFFCFAFFGQFALAFLVCVIRGRQSALLQWLLPCRTPPGAPCPRSIRHARAPPITCATDVVAGCSRSNRTMAALADRNEQQMTASDDLSALMGRVALQDRAAFERVYHATCAHLLGVALRILNNRERAEEVLQEAFVNVWHGARGYNPSVATPMTWLINVVRNKAIDTLRSGATERRSTGALDDEAFELRADGALEPQQMLDDSLQRAHIDACMQSLNAQQRQALALAYYRGLVHTEIAAQMGAPLGTAKAWVRRGLDKLKECLGARGVTA
jgi:RNA polymerase sigma-70 factor, ECF subfamily